MLGPKTLGSFGTPTGFKDSIRHKINARQRTAERTAELMGAGSGARSRGFDWACWLHHLKQVPNFSEPHRAAGRMLRKGGCCDEDEVSTRQASGTALVLLPVLGQPCVCRENSEQLVTWLGA